MASVLGSAITEQFSASYNSFSGCDIQATLAGMRIGELQGISFTVTREKVPIFVMGRKDPVGYSRCKRGIAGSMVFAVLDRSALLEAVRTGRSGVGEFVVLPTDEMQYQAYRQGRQPIPGEAGLSIAGGTTGLPTEDPRNLTYQEVLPFYLDQIPPFNIVLNAVNEYGYAMVMTIHNVEILNHGSGISIDDPMIDESMTWVATNITPWETHASTSSLRQL